MRTKGLGPRQVLQTMGKSLRSQPSCSCRAGGAAVGGGGRAAGRSGQRSGFSVRQLTLGAVQEQQGTSRERWARVSPAEPQRSWQSSTRPPAPRISPGSGLKVSYAAPGCCERVMGDGCPASGRQPATHRIVQKTRRHLFWRCGGLARCLLRCRREGPSSFYGSSARLLVRGKV